MYNIGLSSPQMYVFVVVNTLVLISKKDNTSLSNKSTWKYEINCRCMWFIVAFAFSCKG